MHVTFVASSLIVGGIGRVIETLSPYLVARGDRVSVVTFYDAVFHAHAGDYYALAQPRASKLTRLRDLRRVLRDLRPDVVIAFGPMKSLYTLLVSPAPVIVSLQRDPWTCPRNLVWEFGWRQLYPKAAAVVVLTPDARGYLDIRHVRVIPNPVPPLQVHGTAPRLPANTILTVGRLQPEKGPDLLIKAFALLAAANWHLALAGDGPMRADLELLARELGIVDRVLFLGAVQDVYGLLAQAKIFMFPSRSEGLGIALLEAMNAGLPVIATSCAGPASIITPDEDGLLTPIGARGLADGLARLLDDPPLRARLGAAAKQTAARYDIETVGAQWYNLMQEVA